MSTTIESRGAGLPSGASALRRVVAGDPGDFVGRVWSREPQLSRANDLPGGFDDLLTAAAVDELVSQRGLRTPFLRVAKNGTTLGESAFTSGGGIGATVADQVNDDKLVRLFADGATLVLQGLHRLWPPLIDFTQALAADLGHPVQANAYVTPPQNRGFDDHYDVHDVFVLQVEGEKRWVIHRPVHDAPLRDQPWTDQRAAVAAGAAAEPLLDVVLRPGDALYLPRGYLHAATALGGVSIHLTLGVHVWTRYAMAEQLAAEALALLAHDPEVRGSLAFGASVGDVASTAGDLELVRSRLAEAVREVAAGSIATRLAARARSSQRPAPVGPLAQLRAASTLSDDALVVLREHLDATVHPGADGGFVLRSRAGAEPVTVDERPGVDRLLEGAPVRAGDVGVELVRRLVRAGVVVDSR